MENLENTFNATNANTVRFDPATQGGRSRWLNILLPNPYTDGTPRDSRRHRLARRRVKRQILYPAQDKPDEAV